MHGLLFLLAPTFLVLAFAAYGTWSRDGDRKTLLTVNASVATATMVLEVFLAFGQDEDTSTDQSRWTAHGQSHAWFVILFLTMTAVIASRSLSHLGSWVKSIQPAALLLAAPTCFQLFTSLSH